MTSQTVTIGSGNTAPGFRDKPDHEVTREVFEKIVEVRRNHVPLAQTEAAILVRETGHTPVLYLPLLSINMDELTHSDHTSYCPFKGEAVYWSIAGGTGPGNHADPAENAVWAYPTPYDETDWLQGFAAFYPNKVEILINGLAVDATKPDWPEKL